jgi:hypothetical protein
MIRTSPHLAGLLTPVKQKVLAATLLHPDRAWYLLELARSLSMPVSSIQHELGVFVASGLLTRRKDGNRVYYQADRKCPIYPELAKILVKTVGVVDVLKKALAPLASHIDVAFLYGSIASSKEQTESDIDLMVVGDVQLLDLSNALLRRIEPQLGRSVNPTVYTTQEFQKKVREGHHFLTSVLEKEILFVHGAADDLANLTRSTARASAPDEPTGNARSKRGRRKRP